MTAAKRSTALSIVITVMAMLGMTGCQDATSTDPTVTGIALAKGGGGGKGPKVESTDPTQASQDTTLDVRVFGSSFDNGSSVTLTIDGTPSGLVRTNSTTFMSDTELIANITIDLTAIDDLYDVEVVSSRGRKGIGADLFSVKKKGDTEPEFVITTTDLGTLEGSSSASAKSVVSDPDGSNVRVVGGSGGSPFFWTANGGMVKLTVPEDASASLVASSAVDINAAGQIVGYRLIDFNIGLQAIFWSSSSAGSIDLPTQARTSRTTAIDNSGQVAGYGNPADPDLVTDQAHAILWTVDAAGIVTARDLRETFQALGFLQSIPEGINDRGQVVGWAYDGFRERAFLWDNGVVTLLDDAVAPDFFSFAYAINNADPVQIVGGAHDQTGSSRRALLWTVLADGTVLTEELPLPAGFESSWPTDLNDVGEVVGSSEPQASGQDGHATLWTFDPNTGARTIVDLGVGWAGGIDNSASLVGLTRVVGSTTITVGKGRKKTTNNSAILWQVEPPLP